MGKRRGHGEGSIYQRSDGKWCGSVDLGYIGGKRKRKVVYGDTRKDVAEKIKILLRQQQLGQNIAPDKLTVAQFLQRWMDDVIAVKARPLSIRSYEYLIRNHITPTLGHIALTKLTPQDVQTLMRQKIEGGLAASTVLDIRSCLRAALNQAMKWELVGRNVATLTTPPRDSVYKPVILSTEQCIRFIEAVRGHRLEALYLTALTLGLRRGEVLALRWSDIDIPNSVLRVSASMMQKDGKSVITETKTRAGVRTLPLPEFLAEALAAHSDRQSIERGVAGKEWKEHTLVFPSPDGSPLPGPAMYNQFKVILQRANLPDMRFHDLRHACASLLAANGVHPRVAMEILGHSNIAMTQNIYTHILDVSKREVATMLDRILDKKSEK